MFEHMNANKYLHLMRRLSDGTLIVIDGPSGSGKDTLISKLKKRINYLGFNAYVLSEEEMDKERSEIIAARNCGIKRGGFGDKEMVDMLVLHKSQIYRSFVEPILWNGGTVLANRGEPATLAYQTARSEVDMDYIWHLHRLYNVRIPDLVVITFCAPETALLREKNDQ